MATILSIKSRDSEKSVVVAGQRSLARETLDNDNLVMHFQPMVDEDSRAVGVEALARLQISEDEVVSPANFLDAIDGTDLVVRLDLQALALSCQAAASLARDTKNAPYVAFNFSAQTLLLPDIAELVVAVIDRYGVAHSKLCIEVTETAVLEADLSELHLLREAGVGFALDNFGSGSCSLAALQELPLTSVKVDRWFTSSLDGRGSRYNMALAVVEMAKSLQVPVIAEGIENARQWRSARDHGLSIMQGWLHSKPMPLDELSQMLTTGD
jgi:EAL domain-containing protein (putative c-di-GMP-specific phosphodiesterase class I)